MKVKQYTLPIAFRIPTEFRQISNEKQCYNDSAWCSILWGIPTDPIPTDPIPTDPIPTDPIPTYPVPTVPVSTDPDQTTEVMVNMKENTK